MNVALILGATIGFFKYFRIEGLDNLTLALRDSAHVQMGASSGSLSRARDGVH